MLTYAILGVLTFLFQIYLRAVTKGKIDWNGSFLGYLTTVTICSIIWPLTITLICIGIVIGISKRG